MIYDISNAGYIRGTIEGVDVGSLRLLSVNDETREVEYSSPDRDLFADRKRLCYTMDMGKGDITMYKVEVAYADLEILLWDQKKHVKWDMREIYTKQSEIKL